MNIWKNWYSSHLNFQVHYNVGKNLADKGNQTAAINYYREAVRYDYFAANKQKT